MSAERLGFDADKLDRARQVLNAHVAMRTTPGAVGLVVRRDGVVACWAVGKHTYEPGAPDVRVDDWYDLASVTKVVVTATLCLVFSQEGMLDLDAPVQKYVPAFSGPGKEAVTLRRLLAHCGGLPAHVHLYKRSLTRKGMMAALCGLDLVPDAGAIYSDMGYLLIGLALEAVGKDRLDRLAKQCVFDPLGMDGAMYCPPPELRDRIAPTEVKTNLRTGLVHGEVHDENAAALGGVAAHAGVFARAQDLGRFLRAYLGEGMLDGRRVLPAEGVRLFTARAHLAPQSTRALGWDTVSPEGSTAGRYFSPRAFGALGFTGTSIWADPERDLGVVLLTNRVHPTRENGQIKQLRPEFHDAVSEGLVLQ